MILLHFGSKAHDRYMAGQYKHPWTTNYLVNKPADAWEDFAEVILAYNYVYESLESNFDVTHLFKLIHEDI